MSETKTLTKKQSAVIEDLFTSELEEPEILEKHHVRLREYERWLADEDFTGQIEQRIAHAHRQSRIILARNATNAASKLVELTACEKEETARKACLDIIALHAGQMPRGRLSIRTRRAIPAGAGLTPEMAGRLLAALAGHRQDRPDDLQQAPASERQKCRQPQFNSGWQRQAESSELADGSHSAVEGPSTS